VKVNRAKPLHIAIAGPIETRLYKSELHEINKLPKGMGGGTAVDNLILGLLKHDIQLTVLTLTPEITEPVTANGDRLSILFAPYRRKARYRMLDLFKKEAASISTFAQSCQPDIIHAQWGYEYADGAISSGLPYVITLRDSAWKVLLLKRDLYRFCRYLLNKKVMKKGDKFIVNSPYLNQIFNSTYPIIFNSVIQYPSIKKKESKEIKIISVMNGWGKIKNPESGIKAFSLFRKAYAPNAKYYLAGQDFGEGEIAHLWAKKFGFDEGVVFLGRISNKDLRIEFSDSTLLLHPSKEESFGNVIAEALSIGLPVIGGSNSGAVPWLLDFGKRGFLVDINHPERIYKKMVYAIENQAIRMQFAQAGLKFANEFLSIDSIVEKHLDLYRHIIKNSSNK
jgi:glycosyltransferase involved in cell wall biosynthesis